MATFNSGLGTTFEVSFDSGSSYTAFPNLEKVDGLKSKRNITGVPVLGNNALRKIKGQLDHGNSVITFWHDPADATHAAFWSAYVAGNSVRFRETYEDTHKYVYDAYLESWEETGAENNGCMGVQSTLAIDGDITRS